MLCANVQPHNGHHSPLRLYCSCDQTMVMILPTGGIFNWDTAEKIKTKGFLLQSPLSPFHVYNQFDFQNKVINFTRWLQQYLLFAYQYILFIRSTINLSCNHPCFRRSILLCATLLKAVNKKKLPRVREEVRSHGDAGGSVSFKVSRWLSRDLILSFSVT